MPDFAVSDFRVDDTVRAFHPIMFGVVCTATVTKIGTAYLTLDFGPLHGGTFRVHPRYVTDWA